MNVASMSLEPASVSLLNVKTTVASTVKSLVGTEIRWSTVAVMTGRALTNVIERSTSTTSVPSLMNPETVKPKVWTPITAETTIVDALDTARHG